MFGYILSSSGVPEHTADKNYIIKIIKNTFYQQNPHKYFSLIILMTF
jgi:hypothetical protein